MLNLLDNIKNNWKKYSTYIAIAFISLIVGMTATEIDTLKQILVNTLSSLISQLPWFILFYLGFKLISNEIKAGVKSIPQWLEKYEHIKNKQRRIDYAMGTK